MISDLVDDAIDSLNFVHSKLPSRVAAAYQKTLTNGWCTPSRFGSPDPCYLCGTHSGSLSTINVCPIINLIWKGIAEETPSTFNLLLVHQPWHLDKEPEDADAAMIRIAVANYLSFRTYHHFRHSERPPRSTCLAHAYRLYTVLRTTCTEHLPALASIGQIFGTVGLTYNLENGDDEDSCGSLDDCDDDDQCAISSRLEPASLG